MPDITDNLTEAKMTKRVSGRTHDRGDFLVQGDPDTPDTWRLPVKIRGADNRQLAGAAWAALFSKDGFRGNKYEGPDKGEAQDALRKLYADNDWPTPKQEAALDALVDDLLGDDPLGLVELDLGTQGVHSALANVRNAFYAQMGDYTSDMPVMHEPNFFVTDMLIGHPTLGDVIIVDNLKDGKLYAVPFSVDENYNTTFSPDWTPVHRVWMPITPPAAMTEPTTPATLGAASTEVVMTDENTPDTSTTEGVPTETPPENDPVETEPTETEPTETTEAEPVENIQDLPLNPGTDLAESAQFTPIEESLVSSSPRDPIRLKMRIIKAGAGNPTDNHYYPGDMLRRDARVFEGAKMQLVDHREDQRSVLLEAGTVDKIVDYEPDGSPIAEVTIFHPEFAEQVRNRIKSGKLHTLHCSILGRGIAEQGEIDGEEYNIVKEITGCRYVDFVSKAGAGGMALSQVAEAETKPDKEASMPEDTATNETQENAQDPQLREVDITEGQDTSETPDDTQPETPSDDVTTENEQGSETTEQAETTEAETPTDTPDTTPTEADPPDAPPTANEPSAPAVVPAMAESNMPAPTSGVPAPITTSAVTPVSADTVRSYLAESNLPATSQVVVAQGTYGSLDQLTTAIQEQQRIIKELTQSGAVFGEGARPEPDPTPLQESDDDWWTGLSKRYGFSH